MSDLLEYASLRGPARGIPPAVRLAYAAFLLVLVPAYWRTYGPANFLNYCDSAVLVAGAGLLTGSPLLISTAAVAALVPQTVWTLDLIVHLAGGTLLGMTDYMTSDYYPLGVRLLSLFHVWLPAALLWAVHRVGYDRRAFVAQVAVTVLILGVSYVGFDPPGTVGGHRLAARNLNDVYGPRLDQPQHWVPPLLWLGLVLAVAVVGFSVPARLLLRWWFPPPAKEEAA